MKLKPIGLLIGLLTVLVGILYWQDSANTDAMDKYISEYKKFQEQAEQATKYADSLAVQIVIAENEARAAEGRALMYKESAAQSRSVTQDLRARAAEISETVTDTLELARTLLPVQDSIIETQETTIETQVNQIQELETVIRNKDLSILFLTASRDSLQSVVNLIPPAPKNPNRMFGIKLPSRKTTFVAGVVAGIVVAGVVLK